jgi:NAD(P)-dependent dehydrogenase (short-subunit alcohol dehydrogenase family)
MTMAQPRFDGARVVLTGVGREGQVGEAIAAAFAAEGAVLVLMDRDQAAVDARAAALVASGAAAIAIACDLTDADQLARAAASIAAESPAAGDRPAGRIDALVHIAGGFAMSGPIGESDLKVLDRMIQSNLMTAYLASRAFVPMVRDGGSVVYFASASILPGAPAARISGYLSAKSAVVGLMRSVADEGRARHLRANAVAPISVRTRDNIRDMGSDARYVEREAVADAVVFLCSRAARAITGQILRLTD